MNSLQKSKSILTILSQVIDFTQFTEPVYVTDYLTTCKSLINNKLKENAFVNGFLMLFSKKGTFKKSMSYAIFRIHVSH
jgi:hypothetical protein